MGTELTVGTACHNDWDGVYFTVQSLRTHHAQEVQHCELVVVDNDPDGKEGGWTRDLVENWVAPHAGSGPGQFAAARYVRAPEVEGTAAPRDRVFREAQGRATLCLDCHVLLEPGALASLLNYYSEHPDCNDLLSGPILMDDLVHYGTHFDDVWRDTMWGVWARAWQCPCGYLFCPREVPTTGKESPGIQYLPLMFGTYPPYGSGSNPMARTVPSSCPQCRKELPEGGWWGHEGSLEYAGFRPVGKHPPDPPFEIPAMGLGLFSCRTRAWPGFNPRFRGFGGEEFYVHTKFRQAGHRCLCLPSLRWTHRFTRQGQAIPYPLNNWHKLRNHVIGHQELGLPLDRLHAEWVGNYHFPQNQWDEAVAGAEWPSGPEHEANRHRPHQFAREVENESREGGRLGVVEGSVVVISGARSVHTVR